MIQLDGRTRRYLNSLQVLNIKYTSSTNVLTNSMSSEVQTADKRNQQPISLLETR